MTPAAQRAIEPKEENKRSFMCEQNPIRNSLFRPTFFQKGIDGSSLWPVTSCPKRSGDGKGAGPGASFTTSAYKNNVAAHTVQFGQPEAQADERLPPSGPRMHTRDIGPRLRAALPEPFQVLVLTRPSPGHSHFASETEGFAHRTRIRHVLAGDIEGRAVGWSRDRGPKSAGHRDAALEA